MEKGKEKADIPSTYGEWKNGSHSRVENTRYKKVRTGLGSRFQLVNFGMGLECMWNLKIVPKKPGAVQHKFGSTDLRFLPERKRYMSGRKRAGI